MQSCTPTGNAPGEAETSGAGDPSVIALDGAAVVEIESGKITGAVINGIYAFKGVPYGATTAGQNRFCPARKPEPWTGIRSSRQYGLVCPQDKGTGRLNDEEAFMFQWQDSVEGEDCLRVNVWTPGINDNAKRPVMVWLHGGGFSAGSGHDTPMLDGENLARRGDVVVVSLNHRLNILGFLDLSNYGEKYTKSGNVGMLDIITALEWVRDNLTVFGGDPGRQAAVKQAAAKTALNAAPAYLYWFMWQTPIFDGRPQSFHCAELPFVFYNTDRCATMTGGGPVAHALGSNWGRTKQIDMNSIG